MPSNPKITIIVATYNEAEKLSKYFVPPKNIEYLIIVIDLSSSDDIANVVKALGGKLIKHEHVPYVEKIRGYSISQAQSEWVLVLDPDERVEDSLWEKIADIIDSNEYDAVNIPSKNIFFNRWISHTNFWPDKHLRLFKKVHINWPDTIHAYPKVSGKVLELPTDPKFAITHFGYDTYSQFLNRQNRYSTSEANNLLDQGVKFSKINLVWKPLREFLVRGIKHQAYLDGLAGWGLVFGLMVYQVSIQIKLWQKQNI